MNFNVIKQFLTRESAQAGQIRNDSVEGDEAFIGLRPA
jgi:hypothetical protein